jgi:hypothetical protein
MPNLNRRHVLAILPHCGVTIALAGWCWSCRAQQFPATPDPATERKALAVLARLLIPHDTLPDAIYLRIADAITQRASSDPGRVRAGLAELDRLTMPGDWLHADDQALIAALRRIEGNEFFTLARTVTGEVLYRDPEVWRLVGYGGSAIEQGGYLTRGFDAIDWLPD